MTITELINKTAGYYPEMEARFDVLSRKESLGPITDAELHELDQLTIDRAALHNDDVDRELLKEFAIAVLRRVEPTYQVKAMLRELEDL